MCVVSLLLKVDEAERFVGHLVGETVRLSCGCAAGGCGGGCVRCYKICQRDILTGGCVQNCGFLTGAQKSLELLIFTRAFLEEGCA